MHQNHLFSDERLRIVMFLLTFVTLTNSMNVLVSKWPDHPPLKPVGDDVTKYGGEPSSLESTGDTSKRTNEAFSPERNEEELEINPFANILSGADRPVFAVRAERRANSDPDDKTSLLTRLARSASSAKDSQSDVAAGDSKSSEEKEDYVLDYDTGGRWLADAAYYDYQADAPAEGAPMQTDECPRVPEVLPAGACAVTECKSDRECQASGRQCCYNGCTYTCLAPLKPPPFIDWIREPRRRLKSGTSWLVAGPVEVEEVESCSTTKVEEDEDPLLCPHGYVCSIVRPGNPEKNIPNRGRCVREMDDSVTLPVKETEGTPAPRARQRYPHGCDLGSEVVLEGGRTIRDGKTCTCRKRKLRCTDLR